MSVLLEAPPMARKNSSQQPEPEKRIGRPPAADGIRERAIVVRGRDDWKSWVQELSDFCRLDLSDLVDAALVDYARTRGFDKSAPKR